MTTYTAKFICNEDCTHENFVALYHDVWQDQTLEEIAYMCKNYGVKAELYDSQENLKGRVGCNGNWRLI